MSRRTLAGMAALLIGLSACNAQCRSLEGSQGIVLTTRDARSGRSLDSIATLTVTRPGTPPTTRTGPLLSSGPESPQALTQSDGLTYIVRVDVPGYQSWEQSIHVPTVSEQCESGDGFRGVRVTAQLQPT